MSLLSVGAPCATCSTVDFLPFRCPDCSALFCRDHVQLHHCASSALGAAAGSSRVASSDVRGRCAAEACTRVSLEALAGYGWTRSAVGDDGVGKAAEAEERDTIAKQVRCPGCGGSFCSVHRQQAAHACQAPPDHTARQSAAEGRKRNAAAVLTQHFPAQAGRTIPKPPPAKDTAALRPPGVREAERLFPSARPGPGQAPEVEAPAEIGKKRPQGRAEKLWDVHVRKVRSLAEPLDGKKREGVERRVFERAVDEGGGRVRAWLSGGKWDGELARAWVPIDMACGRVFDLMVEKSGASRSSQDDPRQQLSLVALEALPDQPRTVRPVSLSDPASKLVEGSLIVLIRGPLPEAAA